MWEGGPWRSQPPVWETRPQSKIQVVGSWVPGLLDLWVEVLEIQTLPFLRKAGVLNSVTKGLW